MAPQFVISSLAPLVQIQPAKSAMRMPPIGMVRRNGVDNVGSLAVPLGKVGADLGVRSFHLMVDCFADIVEKSGSARFALVEAELSGHDAGDMRYFKAVVEHALTIARAIAQLSDEL